MDAGDIVDAMNMAIVRAIGYEEPEDPDLIVAYYEEGAFIGNMTQLEASKRWWKAVMEDGKKNTFMTSEK